MKDRESVIVLLFLVISAVLLWFAPAEQTLGQWVKLIYFHATLSLAGLYAIYASGALGLAYLAFGKEALGRWSAELSLWAIVTWFFSVILSLVSMQVAWGGLMWNEPRTVAALTMLVLGAGKELLVRGGSLRLKASAAMAFAAAVLLIRSNLTRVMHPDNPIAASESLTVKIFPLLLLLVTLATLFEFTRRRLVRG